MKAAVIYYSKAGATKVIAQKIADKFGAEMIFVEPEKAYGNYVSAVLRVAGEKLSKKAPAYKTMPVSLKAYDTVFVGFPVWYGTIPQHLQDYLKQLDLSGKRVIPFATAGANGKESALQTLKNLAPKANITDYFYTSATHRADADAWLQGIEA